MNKPLVNAAYILAGGLSTRMNGEAKGLQTFGSSTLIEHVFDRLTPQVDNLFVNSHLEAYQQLGFECVDEPEAGKGPLNGVLACLEHYQRNSSDDGYVLVCPCDAPFLPLDLSDVLLGALTENKLASVISYQDEWQPVFSLWHSSLLAEVKQAVESSGWGGIKIFLKSLNDQLAVVNYPTSKQNPFLNINSLNDLSYAESLISGKK